MFQMPVIKNKLFSEENEVPDDKIKIRTYDDFMKILRETNLDDKLVDDLAKGLVGWPNFKDTFIGKQF